MFYLWSMAAITCAALSSVDAVARDLKRSRRPFSRSKPVGILNHLQNVIAMGAALSRYFWPAREGHEDRGTLLREQFQVSETSPLKSRDLRNAIEHFDEKLDVYFSRAVVGVVIPHYVGPSRAEGDVPGHLFRAYFTDTGIFQVLDKRFEMVPLVDEIIRIDRRIAKQSRNEA
jgi:hypothetical protein